jgi:predicted nucleic acid-binding protein
LGLKTVGVVGVLREAKARGLIAEGGTTGVEIEPHESDKF